MENRVVVQAGRQRERDGMAYGMASAACHRDAGVVGAGGLHRTGLAYRASVAENIAAPYGRHRANIIAWRLIWAGQQRGGALFRVLNMAKQAVTYK